MVMQIQAPTFLPGGFIPERHAHRGEERSPRLVWDNIPHGTQSLVLISADPDAPVGDWVHWVLYDIPANTQELPEGIPPIEELDNGARQGINDYGSIGYGGPCPPPGRPHQCFFRLYALDKKLNLHPLASREEVLLKMEGHIIDSAQVAGTYQS